MRLALPAPSRIFTPAVSGILVLSVVGFLVYRFAPSFALGTLGLSAGGILRGRLWQFLTYPFLYGSLASLVFSGLVILFVGSAIERQWRAASLLGLWLVVSLSCGILWVLVNLLTGGSAVGTGAAACSYGFIAAMGLLYRGARLFVFFATVEAQYLALGLILVNVLLNLANPMMLIWIAGAPVAYLYVRSKWRHLRGRPGRMGPSGQSSRTRMVELD